MTPKEKQRIETLLTALEEALALANHGLSHIERELGEEISIRDDWRLLVAYAQSVRDELKQESEVGE